MLHVRTVEIGSITTCSRNIEVGLHQQLTQCQDVRQRDHIVGCSLKEETEHGTTSTFFNRETSSASAVE